MAGDDRPAHAAGNPPADQIEITEEMVEAGRAAAVGAQVDVAAVFAAMLWAATEDDVILDRATYALVDAVGADGAPFVSNPFLSQRIFRETFRLVHGTGSGPKRSPPY